MPRWETGHVRTPKTAKQYISCLLRARVSTDVLKGGNELFIWGGGAPVNANGARKTMPVNPQTMQKGKAGMNLDFGVFARVDDHAVHVCRVAEDAATQQNILRVETDFGAVLVRAACGQA